MLTAHLVNLHALVSVVTTRFPNPMIHLKSPNPLHPPPVSRQKPVKKNYLATSSFAGGEYRQTDR